MLCVRLVERDGNGCPPIGRDLSERCNRVAIAIAGTFDRRRGLWSAGAEKCGRDPALTSQLRNSQGSGVAPHHDQPPGRVMREREANGVAHERQARSAVIGFDGPAMAIAGPECRTPLGGQVQQSPDARIVRLDALDQDFHARPASEANVDPGTVAAIVEDGWLAASHYVHGVIGDVGLDTAAG